MSSTRNEQEIIEQFPVINEQISDHGHSVLIKCPIEIPYDQLEHYITRCPTFTSEELEYVKDNREDFNSPKRLSVFIGGRIAMKSTNPVKSHQHQTNNQISYLSVLRDHFGAPILPADLIGSISHKNNYVIAISQYKHLLFPSSHKQVHIGIDIERNTHRIVDQLKYKILTKAELEDVELNPLSPVLTREAEIMLRFSMKESIYKAIHPIVQRYVGFQEVEVYPKLDGTAKLQFLLPDYLSASKEWNYTAFWRLFEKNYIITSVAVAI